MRASFLLCLIAASAAAQTSDLEHGRAMYRSNCAFCHGLTGLGGRGPSLVGSQRKSEADVKLIVKEGVPGTTMPAFPSFEESDLQKLVRFISHLAGSTIATQKITGDAAKGRQLYAKNGCANCHQIGFSGSTYGPELTRIGASRSAEYLRESILEPSHDIPQEFEGVTVITGDGKRATGVRVNEDSFSIQLRMPDERFESFLKNQVKQITYSKQSLMPAYTKMQKADLEDLVAYLASLRGEIHRGGSVKEAEGIR
jgi:putative heme-binding domain-containing protein